MRTCIVRSALVLTAAALGTVACAGLDRTVVYQPARWGVRPGCMALVSKDECRRVVEQPAVVRVWTWGGRPLSGTGAGSRWGGLHRWPAR